MTPEEQRQVDDVVKRYRRPSWSLYVATVIVAVITTIVFAKLGWFR